jgi:hypothetical protein
VDSSFVVSIGLASPIVLSICFFGAQTNTDNLYVFSRWIKSHENAVVTRSFPKATRPALFLECFKLRLGWVLGNAVNGSGDLLLVLYGEFE